MKKNTYFLIVLLLVTSVIFSQTKEKIKASRIVTISQKEVQEFENIELQDEIEFTLIKGDKPSIEIEADDNTHEAFNVNFIGSTLFINLNKSISGAKKTSVRITYTDAFKMLTAKQDASVTALLEIKLSNVTFKCFDNSKLFLNANITNFTLIANDKSKIELNLISQDALFELSKNATVKALVKAPKLKCDMYQKATAVLEGETNEFRIRIDNNSNFNGKNLIATNALLIAEGSSNCNINVSTKLTLEASGTSETHFYGDAKLEIKKFADKASLFKKLIN